MLFPKYLVFIQRICSLCVLTRHCLLDCLCLFFVLLGLEGISLSCFSFQELSEIEIAKLCCVLDVQGAAKKSRRHVCFNRFLQIIQQRVDQMWANVKGGKVKMMFNLNFSFLLIPSCQLSVGLWGHESAANLLISEHRKYLQLQKNIICQLLWLKILFPPQIFPLSTNNKSNFGGVDIDFNI